MGKLRMKRTPAEQAERDLRKAHRAARKAARHAARHADVSGADDDNDSNPRKRRRTAVDGLDESWDEDSSYGPPRPSTSYKPDFEEIRARLEEERFREKMWGALGDDERLDSIEAGLNDYAHIPRRWRGGGMDRMDDDFAIDPHMMEEEDYAEWVRMGIWRKKHAAEHEAQLKQKAERAARREREEALRAETLRLAKEDTQRKRRERERRERARWDEAREAYEMRWKQLLCAGDAPPDPETELRFEDIPWPVLALEVGPPRDAKGKGKSPQQIVDVEDITEEAIQAFLLPQAAPAGSNAAPDEEIVKKQRKEKLRDTMLRFHPDKFEGRILQRVREGDKERAREGVNRVARALNHLMGSYR